MNGLVHRPTREERRRPNLEAELGLTRSLSGEYWLVHRLATAICGPARGM